MNNKPMNHPKAHAEAAAFAAKKREEDAKRAADALRADLTQHDTTDATASHRALLAIFGFLRTWAKARAKANTEQKMDAANDLQERISERYAAQYQASGGSFHQGWGVDLDQAETWWMERPNATDAEWGDELSSWAWDGAWDEEPLYE